MEKLKVLDLFSGIGGFSLGLERTGGFETVAFCEIEEFPRKVLKKHWPDVPCFSDVKELLGEQVGQVDVITGGFPCQDLSIAGRKAGIGSDTRSGLWSEIVRLIGELSPRYVIVENVANLLSGPSEQRGGWFGRVLGDLAECGYDAEWENIPASSVGAPHRRERVYLLAYPKCAGLQGSVYDNRLLGRTRTAHAITGNGSTIDWLRVAESCANVRDGDGFPVKVERDRIHACGNAVVPQIPELIGHAILAAETI